MHEKQFSPIAPPEMLRILRDHDPDLLGHYHLLLAHDVVANPYLYQEIFNGDDDFIIMDNSIIELGYTVDPIMMRDACEIVPVSVAVLPEAFQNAAENTNTILEGIHSYRKANIHNLILHGFMFIPQGRSSLEMIHSFDEIYQAIRGLFSLNAVYWGIPKYIGELTCSRFTVTQYISSRVNNIHLLGFSNDFGDDVLCCRLRGIMGIDSAVPVRMGLRHELLHINTLDHGVRGDYWEDAKQLSSLRPYPVIKDNITFVRDVLTNGYT